MGEQEKLYGSSAHDWLHRWDKGDNVWSIEMSTIDPGYEQTIQIATAEIVRIILRNGFDCWAWANPDDGGPWNRDRQIIEKEALQNKEIEKLGLNSSQYGAALFLAAKLCIDGPVKLFTRPEVKDRLIQVSRRFPG